MKKTLIALAALAATGASFAQVTITGTVASGFQQSVTNAYTGIQGSVVAGTLGNVPQGTVLSANGNRVATQNAASGFGVDTADINFTAKEDIGGGQSVEAKFGLTNVARGGAGTGAFGADDLTLTYTNTSFGRIQMGTTYGAAVHSGIPSAGAPVIDMDGKLFETRTNSDYINYAVPVGPVVLVLNLGEASTGIGLGLGQSGVPTVIKQRSTSIAAIYTDGPLQAVAGYKVSDNRNNETIYGAAGLTKDIQWQIQAGYD